MFSRCPLVSPKRRSFFFVRFLVQRAIFSLSFYFFKNCIFLPFVRFYIKRLYFFSSLYSVKDYTFLLSLFAFQKNCMFPLSVPFRRRLYVSFFISFRQKIIQFPSRSFYQRVIRFFFPRGRRNVLLFVSSPFLASAPLRFPRQSPLFRFSNSRRLRFPAVPAPFFRFYAPRRPGREPFASVSSLAYPLPLPALRAFFPAVFPFPAPVVSRLSVPAPIKNRAGA